MKKMEASKKIPSTHTQAMQSFKNLGLKALLRLIVIVGQAYHF
jgi:hypothetical protein